MKSKIFVFVTLILGITLFFSCKKKEEPRVPVETVPLEIEEPPVDVSKARTSGYVLRLNAGIYVIDGDNTGDQKDKTKWLEGMNLGESVFTGETRKATYDGRVYDFIEVRRSSRNNGREGLALVSQIAVGGSLAVVVSERATLYKSPQILDVTSTILPRKTIVVCYPETQEDGFIEIKGYDPVAQIYTSQRGDYIRFDALSRKEPDIQSSILLQTAQSLTREADKIAKEAMLDFALHEHPSSVFYAEISALVSPNTGSAIRTESSNRPFMTATNDNVNIRDLPDTAIGRVVGSLNTGDGVTISEQTVAEFVVNGQSARWYHISEPQEGWVFGAFLE